jgi:hypothetical protein
MQMLAHQAFFLLAVSNAISASEKDASNMAECHRALAGMSMTKHWLHPYLVVMRPSNGPAARVLCRWRQEQAAAGMVFVDVEIIEVPRARWTRQDARSKLPDQVELFLRRIGVR